MGEDNLTLAKGYHSLFSAGVWSLHRRHVALVSGIGRGGSLDSLQLTCKIIWLKSPVTLTILQFIEQKAWIAANFPKDRRFENLILESENVLTADTVKYVRNFLRLFLLEYISWSFLKLTTAFGNLSHHLITHWMIFVWGLKKIVNTIIILMYLLIRNPDLKTGGGPCLTLGILDKIPNPRNVTDEDLRVFITHLYNIRFVVHILPQIWEVIFQSWRCDQHPVWTGL